MRISDWSSDVCSSDVSAQRNSYVAAFSVLAAMGKAEARDLGLEGGALYDPEVNYRRVKGELWDWADDPAPQQVANDTRAVPAANAQVPEGPPSDRKSTRLNSSH